MGLLGLGTVAKGVYKISQNNASLLTLEIGAKLEIARILVKDTTKDRGLSLDPKILTKDIKDILEDSSISIVVEALGGVHPALDYITKALENGKSVVTANKDLISEHGKELFDLAQKSKVDIFFEASVGGGIPIISPLKNSLAANKIQEVMGIINGTTNYMLTKMTQDKSDFAEVLKEAQQKGYAEADPEADVEGYDAARKLAILASIAFNTRVTPKDVYIEGITKITARDIAYAKDLHYTVKLLGIAKENEEGIEVRVHPCFIPNEHPLASVKGVYNAIFVKGDAVGEAMFYGQGAGEMPTASAVMGDVISAAQNKLKQIVVSHCTCFTHKKVKPMGKIKAKYFVRLLAQDRPGVLASVAYVFGDKQVSLASVLQKDGENNLAEIVLITHKVLEENLQSALKMIEQLSSVVAIGNVIRVEGED